MILLQQLTVNTFIGSTIVHGMKVWTGNFTARWFSLDVVQLVDED